MDEAVSAADANRRFSELLRNVRNGKSVVVTSHGKAVARIVPMTDRDQTTHGARAALSLAAESDCRLLLSEDLQDGFTWRGVSVTNPFGSKRHALLDALLGEAAPEPPDFTEPK
jgi:prevent-host-death family protein